MGTISVVVAGGGTGGHLYPGIAVARELLARRPDSIVSFAGTAAGIEARVVPREGFALDLIRSGGLKGKSLLQRARGAALVPLSLVDAWRMPSRPWLMGAITLFIAVTLQAVLGIVTLLLQTPMSLALAHQGMAMVVLTVAVMHVERLAHRQAIPALSPSAA